jgi:hypothetical protein
MNFRCSGDKKLSGYHRQRLLDKNILVGYTPTTLDRAMDFVSARSVEVCPDFTFSDSEDFARVSTAMCFTSDGSHDHRSIVFDLALLFSP